MAEIFVFGTSTSVAPALVRERLHVDQDEVLGTLHDLAARTDLISGAIPLSTCGRLEVYGVSARPDRAIRVLRDLLSSRTGVTSDEIRAYSYVGREQRAARHLFRVAAGLDSVVFGEAQILGQVQSAMEDPRASRTAGSLLRRLFQHALAAGKRVRAETEIGRGSASVAGAALKLLREEAGPVEGRTAMVIGTGQAGTLVSRLLVKEGLARLLVVNRTLERAEALASELGGTAFPLEALPDLLASADLVVGATSRHVDVVTVSALAAVADAHPRARFFLDLAHPRSFSPDLASVRGVRMLDLGQVLERVAAARGARAAQAPHAQQIVDEEVERFFAWRRSRDAAAARRREQMMAVAESESAHRPHRVRALVGVGGERAAQAGD